jgi:hypothetical protein
MNDQSFALKLQGIFHRLQENLAGKDFYQMRYDQDRNVYLLVVAGEQAKLAHDFMAAVSKYAQTIRGSGDDEDTALHDMMNALEEFASKVLIRK